MAPLVPVVWLTAVAWLLTLIWSKRSQYPAFAPEHERVSQPSVIDGDAGNDGRFIVETIAVQQRNRA